MPQREFLKKIGERIKAARNKRQMKQSELASICSIEKASLSRLEAGKSNPTVKTLYKISKALDVPIAYFFFEEGRPPKNIKSKE
jgi:transcriptional regulator with XRE-family HTH domain